MQNVISFMTANFVAREKHYQLSGPIPDSWMEGDRATQAYFKPLTTYRERFGAMLDEVAAAGFSHLDLWLAHLHPNWASDEHVAIAREELAKRSLSVVSVAGGMGGDREAFDATCRVAKAVDCPILGGGTPLLKDHTERPYVVQTLAGYGLKLAHENHPESDPQQVEALFSDEDDGRIGVAVDTGWFGTQGYDAAKALRILGPRLMHVHLKDVRSEGAHDTCRFGEGIVPIEACVATLREINYTGPISIEHEPHDFDPTEDVMTSRDMLMAWMQR